MKVEKLFKRFIDDYKLPIQDIEDLDYIDYVVGIIDKKEEWEEFINRVKERFGDNVEKYFEYYAEVKESFLNSVKKSPEFMQFNQMDMNRFKIERPNVSKSIYTKDNNNKYFLSIDLKQANFQALKYCGLFKDCDLWQDLISDFTDFPELIKSKYLRSVLFGQLNPSRHITVESYLINNLRPYLSNQGLNNLVMMASDELVYEIDEELYWEINCIDIVEGIREKFGLYITADLFKLVRYALLFKHSERQIEFFEKRRRRVGAQSTLHCIPNTYYLLAYKLFYNLTIDPRDFLIEHDGIQARIIEDVKLI